MMIQHFTSYRSETRETEEGDREGEREGGRDQSGNDRPPKKKTFFLPNFSTHSPTYLLLCTTTSR